ncbi:hypothetical protein MATL_G00192270 [Megalops atlanticus]|uniref:Uncharacterized protein n=1 Tax=Megalops atlanticus TaxID=7932 RepID=A0A9D3PNM4_MEGAT|nr:hypothetical protein MATL_G00192270 [Megalops atlanticus]
MRTIQDKRCRKQFFKDNQWCVLKSITGFFCQCADMDTGSLLLPMWNYDRSTSWTPCQVLQESDNSSCTGERERHLNLGVTGWMDLTESSSCQTAGWLKLRPVCADGKHCF